MDICEHSHLENANDHLFSGESNISSCLPASTSEIMCASKSDQACNEEGNNKMCKLPKRVTDNEVLAAYAFFSFFLLLILCNICFHIDDECRVYISEFCFPFLF